MKLDRLTTDLWLRQKGWPWALAAVLLVCALAQWVLRTKPAWADLARASVATSAPPLAAPDPLAQAARRSLSVLQAFEKLPAGPKEVLTLQRRLWSDAEASGVGVAQIDFHSESEGLRGAGFSRLRIELPLQGTYPQVKALVFGLMRDHPGLILDKLEFERKEISTDQVQATVHLVLLTRL